jgi:hypothetical protein
LEKNNRFDDGIKEKGTREKVLFSVPFPFSFSFSQFINMTHTGSLPASTISGSCGRQQKFLSAAPLAFRRLFPHVRRDKMHRMDQRNRLIPPAEHALYLRLFITNGGGW